MQSPAESPQSQFMRWCAPVLAVLAAYLFCFRFSGLLDYPNLLARASILKRCLFGDAQICANYSVRWYPIPYMLDDLTIASFEAVFSPWWAEQISLFFLLAVLAVGWYRLFIAVNGRPNAALLAGYFLVLSNFYMKGFYPFVLSSALVLWWLSWWWPRRENASLRARLLLSLGLVIIFEIHLAGFVSAAACVACYELHHLIRVLPEKGGFRRWLQNALRYWPIAATAVAFFLLQQAITGTLHERSYSAWESHWSEGWFRGKLLRMTYPVVNHNKFIDIGLFAAVFIVAIAAPPNRLLRKLLADSWFFLACAFVAFYWMTPDVFMAASDVDLRFMYTAYFVFLLAVGGVTVTRRWTNSVCAVLLAAHFATYFYYKQGMNSALTPLAQALEAVPPGKRLVEINSVSGYPATELSRADPFPHFAAYYIQRGGALVGGLFSCRQNKNLAYFCYSDAAYSTADYTPQFYGLPQMSTKSIAALAAKFDYVLVQEPSPALVDKNFPAPQFERVFQSGAVYLFRNAVKS
jgi:hypothetical protein